MNNKFENFWSSDDEFYLGYFDPNNIRSYNNNNSNNSYDNGSNIIYERKLWSEILNDRKERVRIYI